MVVYNVLAVVVLQGSNHSTKGSDWRQPVRSIATNPHYYFFTVACRHRLRKSW